MLSLVTGPTYPKIVTALNRGIPSLRGRCLGDYAELVLRGDGTWWLRYLQWGWNNLKLKEASSNIQSSKSFISSSNFGTKIKESKKGCRELDTLDTSRQKSLKGF